MFAQVEFRLSEATGITTLHHRAHGDQPHVIRHTTNAGPAAAVRSQRSLGQSMLSRDATVTHGAPSTHLISIIASALPCLLMHGGRPPCQSVCSFPEGLCGAATPVDFESRASITLNAATAAAAAFRPNAFAWFEDQHGPESPRPKGRRATGDGRWVADSMPLPSLILSGEVPTRQSPQVPPTS